MIIKSYEVKKNISNLLKYNFFLLYGENFGLKKDIRDIIKAAVKQKNDNIELLSLYESEIIDNEEKNVEQVVTDYKNQKFVEEIILIDNHSTDKTVEIAKACNVTVITKEKNKGFAHSCVLGMRESLKTDTNVVVFTECDGTFSGNDLAKMLPYTANCDMVIGTRQRQVLSEQKTQNSMFFVWGNYLLAKLVQLKYFSLLHLGIVELTDVGCMYRCIRRDSLEKIIEKFVRKDTDEPIITPNSGLFAIFMTMIGIENNLKIVEVPITFKKRIGISKTKSDKKFRAIQYGLTFLRFIITSS